VTESPAQQAGSGGGGDVGGTGRKFQLRENVGDVPRDGRVARIEAFRDQCIAQTLRDLPQSFTLSPGQRAVGGTADVIPRSGRAPGNSCFGSKAATPRSNASDAGLSLATYSASARNQ
jgi:hypothetical protein